MARAIKIFFIVCVISLRSIAECVNIDCNYNSINYVVIGEIYRCEVSFDPLISSPKEALIESATGTHKIGKTNDQVEGFRAEYKRNISYFPIGLEKFYQNLKVISIEHCSIKEIHQSDLKPFPKLTMFSLYGNQVEVLEEGLFAYNPEVFLVGLRDNKLVHIHTDIFSHLNKLAYLYLGSNTCINREAENSAATVKSIIDELPTKCTNQEYSGIKKSLDELEADVKNSTLGMSITLNERIMETENRLKKSKFANYSTFNKQMENILPARFSQGHLRSLTETVTAQTRLMTELAKKFSDLNGKMDNLSAEIKQILKAEILKMGQEQDQKRKQEVEKLSSQDQLLKKDSENLANLIKDIKQSVGTEVEKRMDKKFDDLNKKLGDQDQNLGNVEEKFQSEMKQSNFNLKVMCYMSVIYSSITMVLMLAIYEHCGNFFIRCRREANQEEDSSSS